MVIVRNYIPGERLRWGQDEIGWPPEEFDPQTTWIVFVDGEMEAFLLGAKVMNSLLLIRILGGERGKFWLRPLWRAVREACANRGIAGFWCPMDNDRDAERRLIALVRDGRGNSAATVVRPAQGSWVTGRF